VAGEDLLDQGRSRPGQADHENCVPISATAEARFKKGLGEQSLGTACEGRGRLRVVGLFSALNGCAGRVIGKRPGRVSSVGARSRQGVKEVGPMLRFHGVAEAELAHDALLVGRESIGLEVAEAEPRRAVRRFDGDGAAERGNCVLPAACVFELFAIPAKQGRVVGIGAERNLEGVSCARRVAQGHEGGAKHSARLEIVGLNGEHLFQISDHACSGLVEFEVGERAAVAGRHVAGMALEHRFQQDRGLGEGAALEKRMGQHGKRLHIVRAGGQMSPQRRFARLRLASRLSRGRLGDQRFADRSGHIAPIRFVGGAPVAGQKHKIGERPPADRHIRPRRDRATKGGDRLRGLAKSRKALAQFIEDDRIAPLGLGQRP
jgi:hypothetical protein